MKKLRVVRDRRESEDKHEGDIRGLNDQELFQNSGIEMHLWTECEPSLFTSDVIQGLCKDYGVSCKLSGDSKGEKTLYHFYVDHPIVGEHKFHALKLFFCAMDIHQHFPNSKSWLGHVSGLKQVLEKKIKFMNQDHAPEMSHEQELSDTRHLKVDSLVHLTLIQTGMLPVVKVEPGVSKNFTHAELMTVHEGILRMNQASKSAQKIRKAA